MKLSIYAAMLSWSLVSSVALGQSATSLSAQDLIAAQFFYSSWIPGERPGYTLDSAGSTFPDGAHGYVILETYQDVSHGAYTTDLNYDSMLMARNEYCRASLVVLARATGLEQTVVSPNRQAIYTAAQFKLEKILRDVDSHQIGDLITYVYMGGSFRKPDGTVLRTQLQGKPLHPFAANGLYLLFLDKNRYPEYASTAYFSSDTHQVKIVNNHIYSTKRISDHEIPNPVQNGGSFTEFWNRLAKFLANHPCPSNP